MTDLQEWFRCEVSKAAEFPLDSSDLYRCLSVFSRSDHGWSHWTFRLLRHTPPCTGVNPRWCHLISVAWIVIPAQYRPSPVTLLQLCLRLQVIPCMIGILGHYDDSNNVYQSSNYMAKKKKKKGTGSDSGRTNQWRACGYQPVQTAVRPLAHRCVCPSSAHRRGWCRPAGFWVCWLRERRRARLFCSSHECAECTRVGFKSYW